MNSIETQTFNNFRKLFEKKIYIDSEKYHLTIVFNYDLKDQIGIAHFVEHTILETQCLREFFELHPEIYFNGLTTHDYISFTFRFVNIELKEQIERLVISSLFELKNYSKEKLKLLVEKNNRFEDEIADKKDNIQRLKFIEIRNKLFANKYKYDILGDYEELLNASEMIKNFVSQFRSYYTVIQGRTSCTVDSKFKLDINCVQFKDNFVLHTDFSAIRLNDNFHIKDLCSFELFCEAKLQHSEENRYEFQIFKNFSIPFVVIDGSVDKKNFSNLNKCSLENARLSLKRKIELLKSKSMNESISILSNVFIQLVNIFGCDCLNHYFEEMDNILNSDEIDLENWVCNYFNILPKNKTSKVHNFTFLRKNDYQELLTLSYSFAKISRTELTYFKLFGLYLKKLIKKQNLNLEINTGIYDKVGESDSVIALLTIAINSLPERSFCNISLINNFWSKVYFDDHLMKQLLNELRQTLDSYYKNQKGSFTLRRLLAKLSTSENIAEQAGGYPFYRHVLGLLEESNFYNVKKTWNLWIEKIKVKKPFIHADFDEEKFLPEQYLNVADVCFNKVINHNYKDNEVWYSDTDNYAFSIGYSFGPKYKKTTYLIASQLLKHLFIQEIFAENTALYNGIVGLWRNGNFYFNVERLNSESEIEKIIMKLKHYTATKYISNEEIELSKSIIGEQITQAYQDDSTPIVHALNEIRGYSEEYFKSEIKELENIESSKVRELIKNISEVELKIVAIGKISSKISNSESFNYPF